MAAIDCQALQDGCILTDFIRLDEVRGGYRSMGCVERWGLYNDREQATLSISAQRKSRDRFYGITANVRQVRCHMGPSRKLKSYIGSCKLWVLMKS